MNNNKKYIFSILGGDIRQLVIAKKLLSKGHTVKIYGLGELADKLNGAELCLTIDKAILGSDFVILPLPSSRDNINLFMKNSPNDKIPLSRIYELAKINGCKLILGGMLPPYTMYLNNKEGIVIDFYKSETLQQKNALPSAEGALMIAMENTEITIKNMNAIVCGYGRIGACLCDLLYRLGANVTVLARRDEILCEAAMHGYDTCKINHDDNKKLKDILKNSDVIFNTAPHIVFTKSLVESMNENTIYIEIASSPGGIDVSTARDEGINIIFAPSLPGRYAPITAGEYIYQTIKDILSERGFEI